MSRLIFVKKEEKGYALKSFHTAPILDQLQFLIAKVKGELWLLASEETHKTLEEIIQIMKYEPQIIGGGELRKLRDQVMIYGTIEGYQKLSDEDFLKIGEEWTSPFKVFELKKT